MSNVNSNRGLTSPKDRKDAPPLTSDIRNNLHKTKVTNYNSSTALAVANRADDSVDRNKQLNRSTSLLETNENKSDDPISSLAINNLNIKAKMGATMPLSLQAPNPSVNQRPTSGTAGGVVKMADGFGNTPLHLTSDLTVAQGLIYHNAELEATNLLGETPLLTAARNNRVQLAELLMNSGASVNAADSDGMTALHIAAGSSTAGEQLIDALLRHGANVGARSKDDTTPMWLAALLRRADIVQKLGNRGTPINARNTEGRTAFWVAVNNADDRVIEELLELGADVNLKDTSGRSPLLIAAHQGNTALILLLLSKGAEINVADHEGITPLRQAAYSGHTEVVELLLKSGAEVNSSKKSTVSMKTPLLAAARKGHRDSVYALINYGADINVKLNDGRTPLWSAAEEGHIDIVKVSYTVLQNMKRITNSLKQQLIHCLLR